MFGYVEQREIGVVVGVRVLGVGLADETIGADAHRVVEAHLLLVRLIESSAGDADEHDHDAEVDQVAAVATSVTAHQDAGGGEEIGAGLRADDVGSAQELGRDGGDDAGGEREGEQREEGGSPGVAGRPRTDAADHEADSRDGEGDAREDEVTPNGSKGSGAPGEQRADAGKHQQKEANGDVNSVVEGRSHRRLGAVNVLAQDREKSTPQNHEAGGQQNHVVEQEA